MKNKNIVSLLSVALMSGLGALMIASGCATIMHGSRQDISINSTPSLAEVTVDNQPKGKTPVVVEMKRKENHVVKVDLKGYQPYEMALTHKVSGWVWGNILFGGVIGLAVDAITGGLYNVKPETVSTNLNKVSSLDKKHDHLYLSVVLKPDPRWQRIGTLARAQ